MRTMNAYVADDTTGGTFVTASGKISQPVFEKMVIAMCEDDPESAPQQLTVHRLELPEDIARWVEGEKPVGRYASMVDWHFKTLVSTINYDYPGEWHAVPATKERHDG